MFSLVLGEKTHSVPKTRLCNLDLFKGNDALLSGASYSVKSNVSQKDFDVFVDVIDENAVKVDANNSRGLRMLCTEFGFHGIEKELLEVDDHVDVRELRNLVFCQQKRIGNMSDEIRSLLLRVEMLTGKMVTNEKLAGRNETDVEMLKRDLKSEKDNRKRDIAALFEQVAGMGDGGDSERMRMGAIIESSKTGEKRYIEQDEQTKFKGLTFDGIIGHLRTKCGGNVHEKGRVNITASSGHLAHHVADREWYDHWCSKNEANSWIMFDFRDAMVCLSHYSLKCNCVYYTGKWEVAGSDDGSSWVIVDRRDTDELSDKKGHSFVCGSKDCFFRYIRITQTGMSRLNSENCYDYFCLTEVEFFGAVRHGS